MLTAFERDGGGFDRVEGEPNCSREIVGGPEGQDRHRLVQREERREHL
jgi:hypothetical protein